MKDALGHGSDPHGDAAAANSLAQGHPKSVGVPVHPAFRLNSYTHEIVSPAGDVAARMRLGKNNGIAVDAPKLGLGIVRSGGTALHDAVAMADYRSKGSFRTAHIAGELHYLVGNNFAGHTVRRVKG